MPELMQALRTDHAHLERLLTVLEKHALKLDRGEDPDWDRIIDILDYMIQYPDAVHHPLEERLFEQALQHAPTNGLADIIRKLSAEHESLPKQTLALRELIEDVRDDAAVLTRREISEQIHDYVNRQRQHIITEETRLFPRIENLLTAADWQALQSAPADMHDPIFGPFSEDRFARLIETLAEE